MWTIEINSAVIDQHKQYDVEFITTTYVMSEMNTGTLFQQVVMSLFPEPIKQTSLK